MIINFENVMENAFLEAQKIVFKEEVNSAIPLGSDQYLDLLCDFNNSFSEVIPQLEQINDYIEDCLSTESNEFLSLMLPRLNFLLITSHKLIETFKNGPFYEGVASKLKAFEIEADCLAEFSEDITRKVENLREDDDFLSLISQIQEL